MKCAVSLRANAVLVAVLLAGLASRAAAQPVRIGAKNFSEQQIVGEIAALLIERHAGLTVERRFGLGGTGICHGALLAGEIDLYVEYTGTALMDILKRETISEPDAAYRATARDYRETFDVTWLAPIGFNNAYTIAVRRDAARANGWRTISDLRSQAPRLRAGFATEFNERPDGYPGLRRAYGLSFGEVRDLDAGLMYGALIGGQVDVICAYSTDGRLDEYAIEVLTDDRGFFPPYFAAPVIRAETLARHPEIADALVSLSGTIDDKTMRRMNYEVDVLKRSPVEVATAWLALRSGDPAATEATGSRPSAPVARRVQSVLWQRRFMLLQKIREHLTLTGVAMVLAMLIGIPLGVAIYRRPRCAGVVLAFVEIVQTIPSLAMLAFLFTFYKALGALPAITALTLYALLPIVLNTYTGLLKVPRESTEAADGLGMSSLQKLWWVELPLALPVIIAGVRAATVWTVGIATLSTYIGAGGLGDFISRGLSRNDPLLTLMGAVPAALLAIGLSYLIRCAELLARRQ